MNAPAVIPSRPDLPDWPRLMREPLAAAYLSISGSMLRQHGPEPRHIGRCALWDRRDLDRFADALAGLPLDARQRQAEGDDILRRMQERLGGPG